MSALLYYGAGKPVASDAEFDGWCKRLAKNWDKLDRFRQWQLGSPEEIRTSGFHVKVTWAVAYGAASWLKSTGVNKNFQLQYTRPPERSKRHRVDWWSPEAFIYTIMEIKDVGTKRRNKKSTDRSDTDRLNRTMQQSKTAKGRVRLEAPGNAKGKDKPGRTKRVRSINKFFK